MTDKHEAGHEPQTTQHTRGQAREPMRDEDTRRDDIATAKQATGKTHRKNNDSKGDDETRVNERRARERHGTRITQANQTERPQTANRHDVRSSPDPAGEGLYEASNQGGTRRREQGESSSLRCARGGPFFVPLVVPCFPFSSDGARRRDGLLHAPF